MANDLGAIDTSKPDGSTQFVSVLDDYQRETRDVLVGWGGIEHDLKGRHKLAFGDTASRPSTSGGNPAVAGTPYFNTETGKIEIYNGSSWVEFGSATEAINYIFNGGMELWGSGTTSNPTGWSRTGAGSSAARSTSGLKEGSFTAQLTRVAADCYLSQNIAVVWHGANWWKGKTIVVGAWVRKPGSADGRISINDGVGTSSSSLQSAGSTAEWLQVSRTIDGSATKVEIRLEALNAAGAIQFDAVRVSIGTIIEDFIPELWSKRLFAMFFSEARKVMIAGNTYYLNSHSENDTSEHGTPSPVRCVIKSMNIKNHTAPGSGKTNTYTLRANGGAASPALSTTVTGFGTTGSVSADVLVEKGDVLDVQVIMDPTGASTYASVGLEAVAIPDGI